MLYTVILYIYTSYYNLQDVTNITFILNQVPGRAIGNQKITEKALNIRAFSQTIPSDIPPGIYNLTQVHGGLQLCFSATRRGSEQAFRIGQYTFRGSAHLRLCSTQHLYCVAQFQCTESTHLLRQHKQEMNYCDTALSQLSKMYFIFMTTCCVRQMCQLCGDPVSNVGGICMRHAM